MKPTQSPTTVHPARTGLLAGLAFCLLVSTTPVPAQFEAGIDEISEDALLSTYPTIEGIRAARRAGHPPERILLWISDQGATFSLDLDEAMQLHAEGLETAIIAAMAAEPAPRVGDLLDTLESVYVARPGPREGLSRGRLMKMLEYGAPEDEMLRVIAERGSRAELSVGEAVTLLEEGRSPRLVVAIGRGIVPPEAALRAARNVPEDSPLLDDLLAGEDEAGESMDLGELFEDEGILVEPRGRPRLVVLSDPPGAGIFLAPGNIRPADMLEMPKAEGRAPAALAVAPGGWWVLVEKRTDAFDASIIPAMRTVHDGDGATRTLIHRGTIYYDSERCCRPLGLTGDVEITRIGENQPGIVLGDEFGGMPPYLWDGNRYLILRIDEGRIIQVLKAYEVTRAAGEEKTLSATFVPATADPLVHPASMEGVSTRARTTWEVPAEEALQGMALISGIPQDAVGTIRQRLLENGKATWKRETVDGIRLMTLALESLGRLRLHEVELDRSGPFGMLATAGMAPKGEPSDEAEASLPAEPKPLPAITRSRTPDSGLPLLEVRNEGSRPVLVSLGDGTIIFAAAGERVEATVSPGTTRVVARFDPKGTGSLHGITRFSYNSAYSLILN